MNAGLNQLRSGWKVGCGTFGDADRYRDWDATSRARVAMYPCVALICHSDLLKRRRHVVRHMLQQQPVNSHASDAS